MNAEAKMRSSLHKLLWMAVVVIAFACAPRDEGRALVNASGLTTNDVLALVKAGADVNQRSTTFAGFTPLIYAIRMDKRDIVEVLIASGADVNRKDSDGRTPLMHALDDMEPNVSLIKTLIAHGADPTIPDRDGYDAFAHARQRARHSECLRALESPGSDRGASAVLEE